MNTSLSVENIASLLETKHFINSNLSEKQNLEVICHVILQMADSLMITDRQGDIVYVNPGFERLTGYTVAEVVGKKPSILKSGFQNQKFYKKLWDTILSGKVFRDIFCNKNKEGQVYYQEETITPICDENGEPYYFVSTGRDITERKKAEEKLQDMEQNFRQLVDNIQEVFWILKKQSTEVIYMSPMYESISGYSHIELEESPRQWIEAIHPDDRKYVVNVFKKNHTKKFEVEYRIMKPDGTIRWMYSEGFPIKGSHGKIYRVAGITQDITDKKNLENTKNHFIALISHQLRTPLTSIHWYCETLLKEASPSLSKAHKSYLDSVYVSAKRMISLIKDMLGIFKIEIDATLIQPQKINVVRKIKNIIEELSMKIAEKDLSIEQIYDREKLEIVADPNFLYIIFQNLLTNAIKYSPAGGKITCQVQKTRGQKITVSIADSGYGIPEAEQQYIFKKLFRGSNIRDQEIDGNGLGLYITKTIAQKCGGDVWFDSEENKGTTFYVELPIQKN